MDWNARPSPTAGWRQAAASGPSASAIRLEAATRLASQAIADRTLSGMGVYRPYFDHFSMMTTPCVQA